MQLDMLHTSHLLLCLCFLALFKQSHVEANNTQTRTFKCTTNSRITHLTFYTNLTEYLRGDMCQRKGASTLNDTLYEAIKPCIKTELSSVGMYKLCLATAQTDFIYTVNSSGNKTFENADNAKNCSFICISREVTTHDPSESCLENYSISLTKGVPKCDVLQIFVKCKLRESGSYKSHWTTGEISAFESLVKAKLAEFGIYCDFDVKRMVEELEEEERQDLTYPTRKSTEVTTHEPSESCLVNYSISINKGVPECDALQIFVKCKLREAGSYKSHLTTVERSVYESWVKAKLAELGIYCDFDVKRMVEELEDEERQGLTYPTRKSTGKAETKDNSKVDTTTSNHMDLAIPVALVTPTIVVGICCIIVFGVLLYRKRGCWCKKIRLSREGPGVTFRDARVRCNARTPGHNYDDDYDNEHYDNADDNDHYQRIADVYSDHTYIEPIDNTYNNSYIELKSDPYEERIEMKRATSYDQLLPTLSHYVYDGLRDVQTSDGNAVIRDVESDTGNLHATVSQFKDECTEDIGARSIEQITGTLDTQSIEQITETIDAQSIEQAIELFDTNSTEHIPGPIDAQTTSQTVDLIDAHSTEQKTELLEAKSTEQKTELLEAKSTEEKTELLEAKSTEQKTELLEAKSTEEKTVPTVAPTADLAFPSCLGQ